MPGRAQRLQSATPRLRNAARSRPSGPLMPPERSAVAEEISASAARAAHDRSELERNESERAVMPAFEAIEDRRTGSFAVHEPSGAFNVHLRNVGGEEAMVLSAELEHADGSLTGLMRRQPGRGSARPDEGMPCPAWRPTRDQVSVRPRATGGQPLTDLATQVHQRARHTDGHVRTSDQTYAAQRSPAPVATRDGGAEIGRPFEGHAPRPRAAGVRRRASVGSLFGPSAGVSCGYGSGGPHRGLRSTWDPRVFEQLVHALTKAEHPAARHPKAPEHGADVVVQDGQRTTLVVQAKHYSGRHIKWTQCEHSFDRAVAFWRPEEARFAFPFQMSGRQLKTFNERLVGRDPGVKVVPYDITDIHRGL